MIQAHLVERDQFGFWTHPNYPDLADNCSSNEAQETLRRLGLELQTVFMESDAPRLYDSARSDQRYSEWIPTRPEGSGWFVLSIHDTDNGPVCQYVRPLGEHLSPIDLDAAAEQHERLLSEACAKALNQRDVALLVSLAWPWDEQWWKPTTVRRDMVKACALALAEIERLDRTAPVQGSTCCKGDA
ncbi:hypothetical protein RFP09_002664 [Pseudomonas aeruginosa]|uniref:hypothetical protein n=1 Tax=Pseudomonas aeruginosa TaxID=287 RepID=UPI00109E1D4A|nr:hypothetical protein [Pseudomonas aeruginosa]EKU0594370.1 hypothetical protein [Pseudomonas aeruginosa]EKU1505876.1 hypothetical protein [Pseudomonas aeruginosa]EKV1241453.1 hypothetical protein [Pseudomonas aeruginosa]EKV8584763.1 hypothetical protein [Pseudomonas aeruginosa]ELA3746577.1 hypothetical protein [Pseudomonas aeruginosa]